MDLSNLYMNGRTIHFEFGGEKGKLTYRPDKATRKQLRLWADKIEKVESDDQAALDLIDEQLLELISAWDLTEGDKPLPVSAEVIDSLPVQLKNVMRTAIYSDTGEEAKKSSKKSSMTG